MSWELDGRPLRRVLVTRLRYLGDVVMATVVADALRAGDPELALDFLCEAPYGGVLDGHPALDEVHLLGVRRRGPDARARGAPRGPEGRGTLAMVRALRRRRYDLAVDLFFNPRSAWLLRLVAPRARIGGTTGARRRLYTHLARREDLDADAAAALERRAPGGLGAHVARLAPLRHAPSGRRFLDWLAAGSGTAPLRPRLPRRRPGSQTRRFLADHGLAADHVVVAPAATWPSKEWPRSHWERLLAELPGRLGRPLAVLVPPGREDDWGGLGDDGVVSLPPSPLPRVLEILGGARGLVSVDGGVMHAAVAMGVPTLALFGPTDPRLWFPYEGTGPYRVLATRPHCHPCDLLACDRFVCLPDLVPGAVAEAAAEVLGGARPPEPDGGPGRTPPRERDTPPRWRET